MGGQALIVPDAGRVINHFFGISVAAGKVSMGWAATRMGRSGVGVAEEVGYSDCLSNSAKARVNPGTAEISSTDACLIPWTEPNRRRRIRFLFGPMPRTESMGERRLLLLRRLR